jgi:hypothetical protein
LVADVITVDTREFQRLTKDLLTLKRSAMPFAIRDALTSAAFAARAHWQSEIGSAFTLRNKFTVRSVRVDKAKGTQLTGMHAVVGSVAPYMGDQEAGARIKGKGKHKPIPAPGAAGHRAGAGARTRAVRAKYKLSAINVAAPTGGGYGKRRRNAIAIAVAIRRGQKFALLHRSKGSGRGLFEVRPGGRTARTKLIWDVSRGSVRVPPQPTLKRALTKTESQAERIAIKAIERQLTRHRLFRSGKL